MAGVDFGLYLFGFLCVEIADFDASAFHHACVDLPEVKVVDAVCYKLSRVASCKR